MAAQPDSLRTGEALALVERLEAAVARSVLLAERLEAAVPPQRLGTGGSLGLAVKVALR